MCPRKLRARLSPRLTARKGDGGSGRGWERPIQPSVGAFKAGRAGLHVILRIEMRARGIGRAHGVDNRQMPRVEHRLERRERRVQSEESVQIDGRIGRAVRFGNGDGGPQFVIALLSEGNHHVQAVHGAALEDGDQDFLAPPGNLVAESA